MNRYQDASYVPLASFNEDADLTTTTAPGGHIEGENFTTWNEGRIPWRSGDRGYNGVFLGWNRPKEVPPAIYTLTLPSGAAANWHLDKNSTIELSVAPMDEDVDEPGKKKDDDKDKKKEKEKDKEKDKKKDRESVDFTIELVTSDGVVVSAPASRFASIPPPFKEKFTKLDKLDDIGYDQDWEVVFQSVRAPFSAFEMICKDKCPAFDPAKLAIVRLRFDRAPMYKICISGIGFGKQ